MRFAIFALAASVMATDVSVVWRHEKTSGSTSLTIHSANDSAILAESCGSSIGSLDFSHVDEHGVGNFTVGNNTFDVVSKSQDGVSCSRKYSGIIAIVECSNVEFDVPEGAALSADCFTDEDAKTSFHALRPQNISALIARTSLEQRNTPLKKRNTRPSRLRERQCVTYDGTLRVGDGDPHQNYYLKQLSEVIDCGSAASCSVGYQETKSYTIGFTASVTPAEWITGGFDVTESWSTGNSYTCNAGTGESVCIWYNTAHTAYTVQDSVQNTCLDGSQVYGDAFVLKSPNSDNRGGDMYCVVGTCRAQGDAYWDDSGRAGGP